MLKASNLRPEQRQSIGFANGNRTSLLLANPGTGKTPIALHWVKLTKTNKPTLVVSTKQICTNVWEQEAAKWKGTTRFTFTHLEGCTKAARIKRLKDNTTIHTINYELLPWLIQKYLRPKKLKLKDIYGGIVFDESSFLKNAGTARFKAIRSQVQSIPNRLGMTGTPIGNSLENIWGQIFICCGSEPLGSSFTKFRDEYFDSDWNGWNWTPKPGAFEKIIKRVLPYVYFVPPDPARSGLPLKFVPIEYSLPKNVKKDYDRLKKDLYLAIDTDEGLFEVTGQSAVIQNKLRQIESGAVYLEDDDWAYLHSEKIDRVVDLYNKLNGEPLLIFYEYEHELIRLKEAIPDLVHIKETDAVTRWNNNEIRCMAAHPKSSGHGLNLHLGGAYNMLYLTLPWSLEIWKQAKGRLDRTGQKNQVRLYYFTGPPVETRVFNSLKTMKSTEDRFMEAIHNRGRINRINKVAA